MRSKAILMALLALAFSGVEAASVSSEQAGNVARAWARRGSRLGARLGRTVGGVFEHSSSNGVRFFRVLMKEAAKDAGTIFISSDTEREPVIAFTPESISQLDKASPLWAMLSRDGRNRKVASVADRQALRQKWARFLAAGEPTAIAAADPSVPLSDAEVEDPLVRPLVRTRWGQDTAWSQSGEVNCFNYYMPSSTVYTVVNNVFVETNEETCVCGCVATAMAQLMRFWQYPTAPVEAFKNDGCMVPLDTKIYRDWQTHEIFNVVNPLVGKELSTTGGAYDWENMIECPFPADGGDFVVETNCMAIGKLTYDCGVAVGMDYNLAMFGGSGIPSTESRNISDALVAKFGYSRALCCTSDSALTHDSQARARTILANLDAGCPVILLITGDGGHAVVGDGYGYHEKATYVHLNMGWMGQCDMWYNLPLINTADNPEDFSGFDTVAGVVYNVFTNGTDEIVSGRVTDAAGHPAAGAQVALYSAGAQVTETVASDTGVYSFFVKPNQSYEVRAATAGGLVDEQLTERISRSFDNAPGNSWGNDLKVKDPTVKIGDRSYATLDSALSDAMRIGGDVTVEIVRPTVLRNGFAFETNDVCVTRHVTICTTSGDPQDLSVSASAGAQLTVGDGMTIDFADMAFADDLAVNVCVVSGGVARVAGYAGLGVVKTDSPECLEIAGVLEAAFVVDCLTAKEPGDAFAVTTLTGEDLAACEGMVWNATSDELGAAVSGGQLVWAEDVDVPDAAAIVWVRQGGVRENFRNFGKALAAVTDAAEVFVAHDCRFEKPIDVTKRVTLASEPGSRFGKLQVLRSSEGSFAIAADAGMVVSNLVFKGEAAAQESLFVVKDGGSLTLAKGASLRNLDGTGYYSGAVRTDEEGSDALVTILSGAEIADCHATGWETETGSDAYGGGVTLMGGVLDLQGGTISGCTAALYGDAIYVDDFSENLLKVSGDVTVKGNSVYAGGAEKVLLAGVFEGRVDFDRGGKEAKEGDEFATVDESLAFDEAVRSAGHFRSVESTTFYGTVKAEKPRVCVWMQAVPDDLTVDRENAVVCANGERYYGSLEDAFLVEAADGQDLNLVIVSNDVEKLVIGCMIYGNVDVRGNVTLSADEQATDLGACVSRAGDFCFTVPDGASLTLTNVVFDAWDFDDSLGYVELYNYGAKFIYANGGSVVLQKGAGVQYVMGTAPDSCGVLVENGGSLTMESGSWVSDCLHLNEDPLNGYDLGGGVIVANDGSSFDMRGGTIEYCWSVQGGGAAMSDKSEIRISGDARIVDNDTGAEGEGTENLVLADRASLCLADDFTGSIGITAGYQESDTNVFGYVSADYATNDVTRIQQSAECFFRDDNPSVVGVAIAAAGGQMRLVWSDALKTDEDGRRYYEVETRNPETGVVTTERYYAIDEVPEPLIAVDPPTAVTGLVYNGNEQTGVVAAVGFTLTGNIGTNAGPYTATATLEDGYVWRNGPSDSLQIGWSIAKATYDMSGVVFTNVTYVCDGTAKSNLVDEATLPAGVTVTYVNNGQTEIDTYTVTAKFTGDAVNYEPIDDMTATLTITATEEEDPEEDEPWTVVTNQPSPIAFKSITRVSDTEWALVITNREPYCNYRLIWTDDLTMGFTSTGAWEKASGTVDPVWTTNVITTGGAWFWRAEGTEGTNMVPPQVEN